MNLEESFYPYVSQMLGGILTLSEGEVDKTAKNKIKHLNFNQFQKMLELINGQKKVNDVYFTLYKQKYSNSYYEVGEFEFISNVEQEDSASIYHFVINISDNFILMNAISPESFNSFIEKNKKIRYLFFTLNYGSEASDSSHQAIIMIDNIHNHIYILDPNGCPQYFNSILGYDISYQIERLIKSYFDMVSEFYGYKYEYKFISSWNHDKIFINKSFKNDYIGSGHCVVLSFIIAHIINYSEEKPRKVYEMLKSLWDDELLLIIKDYTNASYNLIKNVK